MTAVRLGPRAHLLALSFLSLFAELALIRWAGSNIVYLAYFSNFVLLATECRTKGPIWFPAREATRIRTSLLTS